MHSRALSLVLIGLTLLALFAGFYWLSRTSQSPARRHLEAARQLAETGEPAAALREWQLAAALDPSLPGLHLELGRALLAQGPALLAVRELEAAARQTPRAPHLWCLLADGYRQIDQQRRAFEAARFAASTESHCGRAHRVYGAVLFDRRQYAEAAPELAKAASIDPQDTESRLLQARNALAQENPRQAESFAREAHQISPTSPAASALLAHTLLAQDRPEQLEEAHRLLKSAVTAFPNDPDMRTDLGRIYLRRKQLPEARAELERAIRLAPRHRVAIAELARLYEAMGKEQEAAQQRGRSRELAAADRRREELETLLRQRPDDSAVLYELADLIARDQQFPRALALMQRAAELRPGDPQVHRQLRDIQDALRRATALRVGTSS